MRIKGLTRMFRGLRANNTPRETHSCPKRRPPRPERPILSVFRRGGLQFGQRTTSHCGLTAANRGNPTIRGTTRRQPPPNAAKPPPTPSHQHAALHNPGSKNECTTLTTHRTERKRRRSQCAAQQESRPHIDEVRAQSYANAPTRARHCREM